MSGDEPDSLSLSLSSMAEPLKTRDGTRDVGDSSDISREENANGNQSNVYSTLESPQVDSSSTTANTGGHLHDQPTVSPAAASPQDVQQIVTEDTVEPVCPQLFGFPLEFGKITQARQKNSASSAPRKNAEKAAAHDALSQAQISQLLCQAIREQQRPEQTVAAASLVSSKLHKSIERSKGQSDEQTEDDLEDDQCGGPLPRSSLGNEDHTVPPPLFVPKASVIEFEGHIRSTTALAINPKGSRLVTGGHDAEVRLWDFNGMTSEPNSFRRFTPIANHSIRALSYSPTGSHFICAAGDAICRIYDVDGNKLQETVKGDMYVRDLSQTKGHTHGLTDCAWHPFDREKFMSASSDATVRVFDLNAKPYGVDQALPHVHIMKAVDKRNLNIAGQCRVTAASWAPSSAKFVVAGCSDGSLQLWNERKVYGKPDKVVRDAHAPGSEISGLVVYRNECSMISRGMDGSMKLWDIRKFKSPVHIWENLPNDVVGLGLCLNPDETMVVTGTSSVSTHATVEVFNCVTFESVSSIPLTASASTVIKREKGFGVAKVLWPEELNQLILGCTDGTIRMFYDPIYSKKGALLFAHRPGLSRRAAFEGFQAPVFTMDNLPAGYKETRFGKLRKVRPREKDDLPERHFNRSRLAPAAPASFLSGKTAGTVSTVAPLPLTTKEDPVESIRAYAAKAEAEPIFVTQAYSKAQPKPILDYSMETGDDEQLVSSGNRCPRCGLKLCQCGYMTLANAIKGPPTKQLKRG